MAGSSGSSSSSSQFSWSGIPWTQANPQPQRMKPPSPVSGVYNSGRFEAPMTVPNEHVQMPFDMIMGNIGRLLGGPGSPGAQAVQGAWGQAGLVGGHADQLAQMGQDLSHKFDYNEPYAKRALSDAFDPMNKQHDYYAGQVRDAAGAQQAQSGIANTPYGAESTGAAQAAFENQWQMQKLQRQNTGANTATTLQNQISQAMMGGGALIDSAGKLRIGALQQVLGAYGLQGEQMSQAMSILERLIGDQRLSISAGSSSSKSGSSGGGGGGS